VQQHTFHTAGDEDWVAFPAIAGATYLIEAHVPVASTADVVLEVYENCDARRDGQGNNFAPGVRLQFKAPSTGMYALNLSNTDPAAGGTGLTYDLSVRALASAASPGALVLVAGRYRAGDPLQRNIHNVTNSVYRVFLANGYTPDRIYYLATDLTMDVDGDGAPDVDALTKRDNLQYAITQWATDKVGADRAFTLYMMDHGGHDRFYLNGAGQMVGPDDIATWLNALEAARPGVRVNVIVEACYSGSFIDLVKSVSKPGRVVIASTGTQVLAHASPNGAIFSDAFVAALGRGLSLYGGFQEAREAVWE